MASTIMPVSYTHLDVYKRQIEKGLTIHDPTDCFGDILARLFKDG